MYCTHIHAHTCHDTSIDLGSNTDSVRLLIETVGGSGITDGDGETLRVLLLVVEDVGESEVVMAIDDGLLVVMETDKTVEVGVVTDGSGVRVTELFIDTLEVTKLVGVAVTMEIFLV